MTVSWTRKSIAAGLGLATTLFLSLPGCGGKSTEVGDAVVVPEPGVSLPSSGGSVPAATSTAPGAAAPTPSTPSAPVKAEGWGTLKGQVTLSGNPPAPKELRAKGKAEKDPTVCAKDDPIMNERLVVEGATKGVKNVLVYIPKPSAVNEEAKSKAATAKLEFDQQNCTFKPHVLAVETGTPVELKNSDPVNHNINSRLKNNGFNKLLSGNQRQEQPVNAPERTPGELTCDIHPWMKAYWMVLDNPYFAVTDEKGNFEIKDVPAGTQKVVVWQEAVAPNGFVTAPTGEGVDIKANDTTTKSFTIDAGKLRPE